MPETLLCHKSPGPSAKEAQQMKPVFGSAPAACLSCFFIVLILREKNAAQEDRDERDVEGKFADKNSR